jgi:hypothetical protein
MPKQLTGINIRRYRRSKVALAMKAAARTPAAPDASQTSQARVFALLGSSAGGLAESGPARRLATHGPNEAHAGPRTGPRVCWSKCSAIHWWRYCWWRPQYRASWATVSAQASPPDGAPCVRRRVTEGRFAGSAYAGHTGRPADASSCGRERCPPGLVLPVALPRLRNPGGRRVHRESRVAMRTLFPRIQIVHLLMRINKALAATGEMKSLVLQGVRR